MPLISTNKIVAAAIQSDRGTGVLPGSQQPMRVFDLASDSTHGIRTLERPSMDGSFGMERPLYGGALGSVTLSWRVSPLELGGVAAQRKPEQDALYLMAGFIATTAADGSVRTYRLTSDYATLPFGTISYYYDGKIRQLQDCVCSAFSFNMESGGYMTCTATYVGYLTAEVDSNIPVYLPFGTRDPYIADGVGWAFNSASLAGVASKSFSLDLNLETPDRGDMGNNVGYAPPTITNRKIGATLVLEASRNTIADWRANVVSALQNSFRIGLILPSLIQIDAPQVTITKPTDGDDSGVMTVELGLEFGKTSAGNDEMSFRIGD